MCIHLHTYVGVDNLAEVTVTTTEATVMWNAVSPSYCGPVFYYVVTAVNLMGPINMITIATSNNVATISNLRSDTSYNISVAAVNRAGTGSSLVIIVATLTDDVGGKKWKYIHTWNYVTTINTIIVY